MAASSRGNSAICRDFSEELDRRRAAQATPARREAQRVLPALGQPEALAGDRGLPCRRRRRPQPTRAARRGEGRASDAPGASCPHRAPRPPAAAGGPPAAPPGTRRALAGCASAPPRRSIRLRSRARGSPGPASRRGCGEPADPDHRQGPPRPRLPSPPPPLGRSSTSRTSGSPPPSSAFTTSSRYPSIASAWRVSSAPHACVKRVPGFASSS